jgi:hypothetical protein
LSLKRAENQKRMREFARVKAAIWKGTIGLRGAKCAEGKSAGTEESSVRSGEPDRTERKRSGWPLRDFEGKRRERSQPDKPKRRGRGLQGQPTSQRTDSGERVSNIRAYLACPNGGNDENSMIRSRDWRFAGSGSGKTLRHKLLCKRRRRTLPS